MTANRLWVFAVLSALTTGTAAAQDARTVLRAAANAFGAENLKCVQYPGSGFVGLVGQQYDVRDDWPRVELIAYSLTINYEAKSSIEERTIRQGSQPLATLAPGNGRTFWS